MTASFVSVHGRRLGIAPNGLVMDGRLIGGSTPTGLGRGLTWYVDSAIDGTDGSSPDTALGTLDEAFAKCTESQGDVIVVMPNHAETITGAGGIAHDVAGVSVIGLGVGNQRPRFLMDAGTTVTYLISAADAYVENLVFAAGHADIVTCIGISTGVGATIKNCEFNDNVAGENFLSCITSTGAANTADLLTVKGCFFYSADAAALGFIMLTDDVAGALVTDNVVVTEGTGLATLITCATGKDLKGVRVMWNSLSSKATAGNLFISNDTASPNNSGIIAYNNCGHADVTGAHAMGAVGGCRFFENRSVSTDALSGLLLPAADVDL